MQNDSFENYCWSGQHQPMYDTNSFKKPKTISIKKVVHLWPPHKNKSIPFFPVKVCCRVLSKRRLLHLKRSLNAQNLVAL